MKNLIAMVILVLSFSAFSANRQQLDLEVESLVNQLNTRFGLLVKVRLSEDCGFSAHDQNDENLPVMYFIQYCDKDINYFTKLPDHEKPVEGLLSIIAHEYAHFLLDFDISEEAGEATLQEAGLVSEELVKEVQQQPENLAKLKKILTKWEEDEGESEDTRSEEEKLVEAVDFILMLGTHENVDSLSMKLLALVGQKADPEVMRHLPLIMNEDNAEIQDMISARIEVLKTAAGEGLSHWSNFSCVTPARERDDFNPVAKEKLGAHQEIVKALSRS